MDLKKLDCIIFLPGISLYHHAWWVLYMKICKLKKFPNKANILLTYLIF